MKRAFFCFLWAIVFFCVFAVVVGLMTANPGKTAEERELLAKQAGERYGLHLVLGSLAVSIVLSLAGLLPGTRRRKQAEPAIPNFLKAEPEVVNAEPHPGVSRRLPQEKLPFAEGVSAYPFTWAGFFDRWRRSGAGVVGFSLIGLFFIVAGSRAHQQPIVWVGSGFAALGLLILLFLFYRLTTLSYVRLSPKGITWSGLLGSQRRNWEQIVNVYRAETLTNFRYRSRDLRLEFAGRGSVKIDQSICGFDSLAHQVQQVTASLTLPRKKAELTQGKAAFGAVTLTPAGMEMTSGFDTRFFEWANLAYYTILNGHLVLHARSPVKKSIIAVVLNAIFVKYEPYNQLGGDMAVRLADVSNYLVLLVLMDECGAMRR